MNAAETAPNLVALDTDDALMAAILYYADRASVVNVEGTNRQALRRLLLEHDLRIASLLTGKPANRL